MGPGFAVSSEVCIQAAIWPGFAEIFLESCAGQLVSWSAGHGSSFAFRPLRIRAPAPYAM